MGRARDDTVTVGRAVGARGKAKRRKAPARRSVAGSDPYRLILETVPAFIWTSRPDGSFEYCNHRVLDYTQCSLEELEGNGWMRLVHPADRRRARIAWERALATGATHEIEYRMCRAADGRYRMRRRWARSRSVPRTVPRNPAATADPHRAAREGPTGRGTRARALPGRHRALAQDREPRGSSERARSRAGGPPPPRRASRRDS